MSPHLLLTFVWLFHLINIFGAQTTCDSWFRGSATCGRYYPSGPFTAEVTISAQQLGGVQVLFGDMGTMSSNSAGWSVRLEGNPPQLRAYILDGASTRFGDNHQVIGSPVLDNLVGTTTYVALTFDNITMSLYMNGTLVGSVNKTRPCCEMPGVGITFGSEPSGANPFLGLMRNYRNSQVVRYNGDYSFNTGLFITDSDTNQIYHLRSNLLDSSGNGVTAQLTPNFYANTPTTTIWNETTPTASGCSQDCPEGQFFETGKQMCVECPENTYSSSRGSLQCSDCPIGQYAANGSITCTTTPLPALTIPPTVTYPPQNYSGFVSPFECGYAQATYLAGYQAIFLSTPTQNLYSNSYPLTSIGCFDPTATASIANWGHLGSKTALIFFSISPSTTIRTWHTIEYYPVTGTSSLSWITKTCSDSTPGLACGSTTANSLAFWNGTQPYLLDNAYFWRGPYTLCGNSSTTNYYTCACFKNLIVRPVLYSCPTKSCGIYNTPNTVIIDCTNGNISKLHFAIYGQPQGDCTNGYTMNSCSLNVTNQVAAVCLGKTKCSFFYDATTFGSDPCPGQTKRLAISAVCSNLTAPIQKTIANPPILSETAFTNTLRIACTSGIILTQAFYGSPSSTCSFPNATQYAQRLCPMYSSPCLFSGSSFIPDPCPSNSDKTIAIWSICADGSAPTVTEIVPTPPSPPYSPSSSSSSTISSGIIIGIVVAVVIGVLIFIIVIWASRGPDSAPRRFWAVLVVSETTSTPAPSPDSSQKYPINVDNNSEKMDKVDKADKEETSGNFVHVPGLF